MQLDTLQMKIEAGQQVAVELHAVEQMLYIPYEASDGFRFPLQDAKGQTIRYKSLVAATAALGAIGLEEIDFVHTSSYGEMIGSPGSSADTELRQRIKLKHDP